MHASRETRGSGPRSPVRRVVHATQAGVRGGLMRVVETLAARQAAARRVAVLSPLPPEDRRGGDVAWEPLRVRGNSDLRGLASALRRLARRDPAVTVIHAGAPGELALLAALRSRRGPVVVVEHAPEHHPLGTPLRNRVYARLDRRAHVWVAVSAAGARALEERWGLPAGTVGHVHAGVDPPPEGLPEGEIAAAGPEGGPLVLALGQPVMHKGFDTFAAVAERLRSEGLAARWLWIGGDVAEDRGAVRVLPWTLHAGGWLRAADLLLVPSRAEGLPLVVLEALACGTPVVASRVGGTPEAVEDGSGGVLVAPGDVGAWCAAVRSLLADPERRRRLGEAGRARWRERFTAEAMVERFERLVTLAEERFERRGRGRRAAKLGP